MCVEALCEEEIYADDLIGGKGGRGWTLNF